MPPFESEWRIQDEDDEVELDEQSYSTQKDAILFCIEITPGVLEPRVLESGEQGPSALETIFQAAADLQKRKIVHGPGDASETKGEIVKPHMYLYQHISQVNAPDIQKLLHLLNEADENPDCFPTLFSPTDQPVTMANVFLTCSHVLRDGPQSVPKAASKRIFFFTDNDDPELGDETKTKAARKNVEDLYDLGINIHPFFMVQPGQPFDIHKFYLNVLSNPKEEMTDTVLNVHKSMQKLLDNMRMNEAIKRTLFNIPMQFGEGLTIGVKAYGLVTEQRKGSYRYFSNMGKSMEEAFPKTVYVDEEQEREVPKESIVFGYQFGTGAPEATEEDGDAMQVDAPVVKDKVFYTPEEMKAFRSFGIQPSIKILGFKDIETIPFDANVKHSIFIHPNEAAVTGSNRTFKALLDSMLKKQKYALTRCLFRKNSSLIFCAMIPQAEVLEDGIVDEPAGFHLIPLPFADDIRQPTIERSAHCSPELRKAAVAVIERMKYGPGYIPYQYHNPGLELHYGFLQAEAFGEEYNPEEDFNDTTAPRFQAIHKRAGEQMGAWHEALNEDPEAAEMAVEPKAGTKRKTGAVDELVVRAHFDDDILNKLTVEQLKTYLKAHSQPYSGRKNDLIERYRPRTLDDLNYHADLSKRLRSLAGSGDFPHMLFYGPSGAGKKTRIGCTLRELFGPGVEKLKLDQRVFLTPSKRKLDLNVVQSNYHIEITPSDVGMYDRVVISEILKEIAQTQQVDLNAKQRFKVVIINEADSLSRDAQAALRRTMERYMSNLRIIMCANGTSKLIAPIKSRCLLVRVAAPNETEMELALRTVAKRERFDIPDEAAAKIIQDSKGNLRRAILVLEAMKMQSPDLNATTQITKPDWETYCYKVADLILQEQSPQRVMDIRAKLYELLSHCIPPTVIMKTIAERLLEVVDDAIKPDIIHWAAVYELRMRQGSKKIYHLEAWVIKVMSIYKHFFYGMDMEDFD
ncbi:unnamed protein product [Rhizoctonia solani]|nr:unnamed protein product [Rhizoctonia solani]